MTQLVKRTGRISDTDWPSPRWTNARQICVNKCVASRYASIHAAADGDDGRTLNNKDLRLTYELNTSVELK